jgi:acyl-CoA thioesterase-1
MEAAPIDDPAVNARTAAISAALSTVCVELDVPYLPVFAALAADPLWMAEVASQDGAHPGTIGYDMLAGLIGGWPAWQTWVAHPSAG